MSAWYNGRNIQTIDQMFAEQDKKTQQLEAEIERLRAELSDSTIKLENEKLGAEIIYQENDRLMHDCQNFLNEIERLTAERDWALDRIAAMAREAERTEVSTAQALERRNLELHGEIKRLRAALDKLPGRIVDCTDVQSILDETGEPQ